LRTDVPVSPASDPVRQPLSDLEIQRALGTLPGWARRGDTLVKTFSMRTFPDGITLVTRVADEAERANHHPDIDIRYTKVTFTLSTHDAGGITRKDLELASAIDRAREQQG
jgi:4a-hydroxytetrahydrobiopterin dehydratase